MNFLRVLAAAVAKQGVSNPLTDQRIVSSVLPDLTVDKSLSATDMVNMVLTFHGANPEKAPELTVPVSVDQFGSYVYQGGNYGDIEFPDEPQDSQVIDQFLNISGATNSMTGAKLPAPSAVTVSVTNGSGVTDQATTTGQALTALGFHVSGLGDATPVGQEAETVVYYPSNTPANVAAAQAVRNALTGSVIMAMDPSQVMAGSQVTVVTGTSFAVNPPTPTASATTSSGASAATTAPTTTTTTPTSSASADFSAPTAAVEPLAAWDPRACTPSGGEGK